MSTHTPGPWREADWTGESTIIHDCPDSGNFDIIVAGRFSPANARLIAAAPDLLSEAKETLALILVAQGERQVGFEEWAERVDGLRAAIAKVEGKP